MRMDLVRPFTNKIRETWQIPAHNEGCLWIYIPLAVSDNAKMHNSQNIHSLGRTSASSLGRRSKGSRLWVNCLQEGVKGYRPGCPLLSRRQIRLIPEGRVV